MKSRIYGVSQQVLDKNLKNRAKLEFCNFCRQINSSN